MSTTSRILAIAGTLVVLVIAFVVPSPGDDKDRTASTTTSTATTTPATATTGGANPQGEPAPPQPTFTTVTVRGSKPVGGIKKIEIKKGDEARIEVTSPDTTDEIHLHGYDLKRDLKAGDSVRFSFVAKSDGIYELELEGAGVQIAELVVDP